MVSGAITWTHDGPAWSVVLHPRISYIQVSDDLGNESSSTGGQLFASIRRRFQHGYAGVEGEYASNQLSIAPVAPGAGAGGVTFLAGLEKEREWIRLVLSAQPTSRTGIYANAEARRVVRLDLGNEVTADTGRARLSLRWRSFTLSGGWNVVDIVGGDLPSTTITSDVGLMWFPWRWLAFDGRAYREEREAEGSTGELEWAELGVRFQYARLSFFARVRDETSFGDGAQLRDYRRYWLGVERTFGFGFGGRRHRRNDGWGGVVSKRELLVTSSARAWRPRSPSEAVRAHGAVSNPTLVWPPSDVESPGAVAWVGAFYRNQARRHGSVLSGGGRRRAIELSKWRLRRPTAVAVHERRIAVVDGGSGTTVLADTVGRHGIILDLPDGFLPVAVAVSKDGGTWYVADGPTGEVRRFDDQGRPTGAIRPQGEITRCGGIAAAGNGDLLMTDVDAGELLRLTIDGMVIARAGGRGIEPGQFNRPTAVAEDPDGTVWVLDALNFRVQHLDSRLRHLGQFGTHGDGSGHLALPRGLTVDPDGHLYVSDRAVRSHSTIRP